MRKKRTKRWKKKSEKGEIKAVSGDRGIFALDVERGAFIFCVRLILDDPKDGAAFCDGKAV